MSEQQEKLERVAELLGEILGEVETIESYEKLRRAYHLEEMRGLSGAGHVARVLRAEERNDEMAKTWERFVDAVESISGSMNRIANFITKDYR